jgi:hypothetical protein
MDTDSGSIVIAPTPATSIDSDRTMPLTLPGRKSVNQNAKSKPPKKRQFLFGSRALSGKDLFKAANKLEHSKMLELLAAGIDPNWRLPVVDGPNYTKTYGRPPARKLSFHGGETPLMAAVSHGSDQQSDNLVGAVVGVLLQAGADCNLTDDEGRTALHFAASHGSRIGVTLLLDAGAVVTTQKGPWTFASETPEWTPLHMACEWHGTEYIIRLLLDAGSDVDAQTSTGETPLHILAKSRWKSAEIKIRLLLQRGASVDMVDKLGRTPSDVAARPESAAIMSSYLHSYRYQKSRRSISGTADSWLRATRGSPGLSDFGECTVMTGIH